MRSLEKGEMFSRRLVEQMYSEVFIYAVDGPILGNSNLSASSETVARVHYKEISEPRSPLVTHSVYSMSFMSRCRDSAIMGEKSNLVSP